MTLRDKIKNRIMLEQIGSEERTVLRFVLGELSAKQPCHSERAWLEKMIRTNDDQIKRMRYKQYEGFHIDRVLRENEVLRSLI